MSRSAPREPVGRLLTPAQAAEMLGLKRSTLYEWAYKRKLPTVRFGRTLRIPESAVQDLIRRNLEPAIKERNDPWS
jgi:excisionase family DNA binding protein